MTAPPASPQIAHPQVFRMIASQAGCNSLLGAHTEGGVIIPIFISTDVRFCATIN